jgi:S1-C subfamily serine protease
MRSLKVKGGVTANLLPLGMAATLLVAACLSVAAARTWTSSGGSHQIEAEFVERKGEKVVLRQPSGKVLEVAMDRLSEDDRNYLDGLKASPSESPADEVPGPEQQANKIRTVAQLVAESNKCKYAKDVLLLFKAFVADPSVPQNERDSLQGQTAIWQERASKGMVRLGTAWILPSEAEEKRKRGAELLVEGLRLLESNQGDKARVKLEEASKADPWGIEADFFLGLGHALIARDAKKAKKHFMECTRREPKDAASLNNLALAEVRLHEYQKAIAQWRVALSVAPASVEITHNLGRLLDLAAQRRLTVPAASLKKASELHAECATATNGTSARNAGWLYMPLCRKAVQLKQDPLPEKKPTASKLRTVATGTGFVVHPRYVLTNRHVAGESDGLLLVSPQAPTRQLRAELVAVPQEEDVDLALVRCDELEAPPVHFVRDRFARQGTEIRVIGFPAVFTKPEATATIGSIVRSFDEREAPYYFMDAVANPGNSGGPVCDATGGVLGVLTGVLNPKSAVFRYTFCVPHAHAVPFVKKHVPAFVPIWSERSAKKEWPDVVELVKQSTVLVFVQKAAMERDIGRPPVENPRTRSRAGPAPLEDFWCVRCYGYAADHTTVKCTNNWCANGTVPGGVKRELAGAMAGKSVHLERPKRVPCPVCHGQGVVPFRCPDCTKGVDKGAL